MRSTGTGAVLLGGLALTLLAGSCRRETAATNLSTQTIDAAAAKPPVGKESAMYEVASTKDLLELRAAYQDKAAAGFTGTFEVHVAAGTYEPATWELAPDPKDPPPAIDIVLRGDGATIPRPSRLIGQSVRVEGLVLTGSVSSSIEIEATRGIVISDAAFIDGRTVDPNSRAPYLLVRARGAVTLLVENTWFVRNWQQGKSPCPLLALEAHPFAGGRFDEAVIRDSVFLGNAFATELALADAHHVRIERSVFYKTWPSGTFLGCRATAKVEVTDSVLVAEDLEHVARVGEGCGPIELGAGTVVYARSYTATTPVPSALKVERAALHDRAAIDATAKVADDAAQMKAVLPPPTLRADLTAALRP